MLANASRRFGRKVEKLTDLSEEEAKQITAGAEQYFLSYPPSQKEKETPHADDLQRLGMAIGALGVLADPEERPSLLRLSRGAPYPVRTAALEEAFSIL